MEYTVGSLFAGVGGICLGFQNAHSKNSSYKLSWANEIDEYACETYRTNFSHSLFQGDIEKILHPTRIDNEIEKSRSDLKTEKNSTQRQKIEKQLNALIEQRDAEYDIYISDNVYPQWIHEQGKEEEFAKYLKLHEQILQEPVDVLNGGFPCQSFSIAGEQLGLKDPRGILFLNIVDLIEMLGKKHSVFDNKGNMIKSGKPRILFLENVKNLEAHDNKNTYKKIKEKLENCGYIIKEKVLNTMDYTDLPQNRERIYIIGFRDKEDAEKFNGFFEDSNLKKIKKTKSSKEREHEVKQIIDYSRTIINSEKYYYTKDKYPLYFMSDDEFRKSGKEIRVNLDEQIDEMYQFYQCRRGQYVRKNKSNVCPTLTANMGTGGHNVPLIKVKDGIRKITPEEAFKLQGFPVGKGYKLPTEYQGKPYSDSHLYKQAGNAVSVPMITMLAQKILEILG